MVVRSIPAVILAIAALAAFSGCEASRKRERDRVATAYADVLIAERVIQGDSLGRLRIIDSVLRSHGFASLAELGGRLREAGREPEVLRAMLDSAQRRIELAGQGKAGR